MQPQSISLKKQAGEAILIALELARDGGRITVSAVPKGKTISISVADTGQGINEVDLPKLFAKFGRLFACKPE